MIRNFKEKIMNINDIINLFSQLLHPNNQTNNQNQSNNSNLSQSNNTQNFQNQTTQHNYQPSQINFPPPLNQKVEIKDFASQGNYNQNYNSIYPNNTIQESPNTTLNNTQQNNNFNLQNLISGLLSNPQSLNLIQQFLPLLSNQSTNEGNNLLGKLLGGIKTNKTFEKNLSIEQKDSNSEIDIDKLIRIDDS